MTTEFTQNVTKYIEDRVGYYIQSIYVLEKYIEEGSIADLGTIPFVYRDMKIEGEIDCSYSEFMDYLLGITPCGILELRRMFIVDDHVYYDLDFAG